MIAKQTDVRRLLYRVSVAILAFWLVVAVAEPILLPQEEGSYALLRYNETHVDKSAANYQPPSLSNHILGTDLLGRDVAAGIIHGAQTTLWLVFWTLMLALFFGCIIGMSAGYYGNDQLRLSIVQIFTLVLMVATIVYTLAYARTFSDYMMGCVIVLVLYGLTVLGGRYLNMKQYTFPLDDILLGTIQVQESIPTLFLLLVCMGIFASGMVSLVLILSFFYTFVLAKYIRNETRILRGTLFVQASKVSGFSDGYIMFRTILPNVFPRIVSVLIYAVASIVLVEATLSFLGLGLAIDEMTWGKLIAGARSAPKAWWLALYPGLAIFSVLYSLHIISEEWRKRAIG